MWVSQIQDNERSNLEYVRSMSCGVNTWANISYQTSRDEKTYRTAGKVVVNFDFPLKKSDDPNPFKYQIVVGAYNVK